MKRANILVIRVHKGEKGGRKLILKITENFLSLGKDTNIQVQDGQKCLTKFSSNITTSRQRENHKSREKKQITYNRVPVRLAAKFSTGSIQARKE